MDWIDGQEIITVQEAAAILGVHPKTLKHWRIQGRIKSVGKGERNILLFKKTQIINLRLKVRAWVPWQKKVLIKGYNTDGLFREEIAQKIGKSTQAIARKSSRLGLTKFKLREFYFLKDVADFFQINRHRVRRWIRSEKLEAVPICSSAGRIRYRISEKNIAQFMAFYPQSWQGLKPIINLLALPEYKEFNCAKT